MNGDALLADLVEAGVLADIDRGFAGLMRELGAGDDVALVAALTSARHRAGHACLPLASCAGQSAIQAAGSLPAHEDGRGDHPDPPEEVLQVRLPAQDALLDALRRSGLVGGGGGAPVAAEHPLVLDGGRLYLQRMFRAECEVAARLRALAEFEPSREMFGASPEMLGTASEPPDPPPETPDTSLAAIFGTDAQRHAAARAIVERRLCVVTGGPGAGKTHLAVRLIALLVARGLAAPHRVALATPTGKAAARLQESVASQLAGLVRIVPALERFTPAAQTIHRLLIDAGRRRLRVDALIVDECSMVDIGLMQRLANALPEPARLVLLGDADQLASVQPGAVFSDICAAGDGRRAGPLASCVTRLGTSYRFDPSSGIGRLARAIVGGDAEGAVAALMDGGEAETALLALPDAGAFDRFAADYAERWCAPLVEAMHDTPLDAAEPGRIPTAFPRRRVLCSHRQGRFGADRFNRLVESRLRQLGLAPANEGLYPGRPVIVTRNDPATGLSNGDTGVAIRTAGGDLQVWFPELKGRDGGPFLIAPSRLAEHAGFFALTVHRAQGSEYDEVAFVPGPAASPVNVRELFYTAVTRARRKVVVLADRASVRAAVARTTARITGLLDRLG